MRKIFSPKCVARFRTAVDRRVVILLGSSYVAPWFYEVYKWLRGIFLVPFFFILTIEICLVSRKKKNHRLSNVTNMRCTVHKEWVLYLPRKIRQIFLVSRKKWAHTIKRFFYGKFVKSNPTLWFHEKKYNFTLDHLWMQQS